MISSQARWSKGWPKSIRRNNVGIFFHYHQHHSRSLRSIMSLSSRVRSRPLQSTRWSERDWNEDPDAPSPDWIHLSPTGYVYRYLVGLCLAKLHCNDCRSQVLSTEGSILSGDLGNPSDLRGFVLLSDGNHWPLAPAGLLCSNACHRKE